MTTENEKLNDEEREGCEYCRNGRQGFDGQIVMMSNHGWQKIHFCPNCGSKVSVDREMVEDGEE